MRIGSGKTRYAINKNKEEDDYPYLKRILCDTRNRHETLPNMMLQQNMGEREVKLDVRKWYFYPILIKQHHRIPANTQIESGN